MDRRWLIVAAVAIAGCGPPPPQAPPLQAHRLNQSLSTISTACGHATEVRAFSRSARELAPLERQAQAQVLTLVRIYKRNPRWIFQNATVAQLVTMSISYLDQCGLHRAAHVLRAETSES